MSKDLRIIFLGTPDFASASLKMLVENKINVVAVITAPDKPKGRGKKLGTSAVKDYALEANIPILQPTNLKDHSFLEELRNFKADLQIVVAFRMLPVAVWDMPRLGTFNLHASLLPQYRGAAPINWAIINGEKETGVTTFLLRHEIDTGEIIFQESEPIHDHDNVGSLYQRLMSRGANLVLKTTLSIQNGDYPQIPQKTDIQLKSAPKIFKEDCKVEWNEKAKNVRNFIRGLSPYPGAWTILNDKTFKLFEVEATTEMAKSPGSPEVIQKELYIHCKDFKLKVLSLQMEGKRRMNTEEFLRGYSFD